MEKTFKFALKDDPEMLIKSAKELAPQNGIFFEGDARSGTFSGHGLNGNYSIENNTMILTISEKPLIIPWSLIEMKLKEFFT